MLHDFQQSLGQTVLNGPADGSKPASVAQTVRHHDRLAIYRRNFIGSLIDVLRAAFPVSERIVGADFFAEAAGRFATIHPPTEPVLSRYGRGFADYLANIPGTRAIPYLPDTARLEWARIEAYFSKDEAPLDVQSLKGIDPEAAAHLAFTPHASTRLVNSAFPIHRIWSVNQPEQKNISAVDFSSPESVLILRPGNSVRMHCISPAENHVLQALIDGQTLGTVAQSLPQEFKGELQTVLAAALSQGVFSNCRPVQAAGTGGG